MMSETSDPVEWSNLLFPRQARNSASRLEPILSVTINDSYSSHPNRYEKELIA